MSSGLKKATPDGCDYSTPPEMEQEKLEHIYLQINEVRGIIGPLSGKLAIYCSDACIRRYLTARNGNVKKAVKMLKASLKWRREYKPENIRWDDVAHEAETGKIYRSGYKDKYGRTVLVMRPRCQNTKSTKGQIKYLVYCMENAILNLDEDQEQVVWLIDFHGLNMSHISLNVTRETANVLQNQYPERLGIAILYDPPKMFEPFWKLAKPFLETKTANKVKFVYSVGGDPNINKIMQELFDMDLVESAFGGKDDSEFNIQKYAERMREDDKKISLFWETITTGASSLPVDVDTTNLDEKTDSEAESDVKEASVKSMFPLEDDCNLSASDELTTTPANEH